MIIAYRKAYQLEAIALINNEEGNGAKFGVTEYLTKLHELRGKVGTWTDIICFAQ